MSRRHGTLDFTGGMNDVTPAHLLRDNQAGLIQNLYLDKDGIWKDISDPSVMLDLSATHLANAIRVVYWKPTRVPADCIDDFVYVVFCSDGVVKLVYRGAGELAIFAIDVKARKKGTNTYYALSITGVTPDRNGNANGMTSTSVFESLTRVYLEGTAITMTTPIEAEVGVEFLHWLDEYTGEVIGEANTLSVVMSAAIMAIAEYVIVPFISVMDTKGNQIADLGTIEAEVGEWSAEKRYSVRGINLTAPLRIYPPEKFQVRLSDGGWEEHPYYIEIDAATANAQPTSVFVRYFGTEE